MKKVFIGGSRRVTKLDSSVRERLDRILDQTIPVLIGDANGADKAVQQYLSSKSYRDVRVFCSGSSCRNNLGNWRVQWIATNKHDKGFAFYAKKDRAMAQEASYGFMIWDAKSPGTLLNVLRLLQYEKKIVVYIYPERKFVELKSFDQWGTFISPYGAELREEAEQRAASESRGEAAYNQPNLFPVASA